MKIINGTLFVYIIACFAICILFVIGDRTFFMDEAMLALSVVQRPFSGLIAERLVWEQSAPVLYLYISKLIGAAGGYSEFSLRLLSLISYIGVLYTSYYISKHLIIFKYPLLCTAIIASFPILIKYSNDFKPYMLDSFMVLYLLIIYHIITTKKISRLWLAPIFSFSIWLSNASCFLIAAILIIDSLYTLRQKEYKQLLYTCFIGLFSLLSLLVYYYFWLKPVIDAGFMNYYWQDSKFELFFFRSEWQYYTLIYKQLKPFISVIGRMATVISIVAFCGAFFFSFINKNKYINIFFTMIVIIAVASHLGYYPINSRLMLFLYPIIGIFLTYTISSILLYNIKTINIFCFIFIVIILVLNFPRAYITDRSQIYSHQHEIKYIYSELIESLKPDDKVYVDYLMTPCFLYLNNYDSLSLGKYKNNVTLGKGDYSNGVNYTLDDIEDIKYHKSLYIIRLDWSKIIGELRKYGTVKKVYSKYETHLYHYSANSTKVDSIQ